MATAESKPQKTIVLKSSDGDCFVVEESVAILSVTIRNMIEEDCADGPIPLPNVSSKILSKVIEYCKRHADPTAEPEPEANHLPGGQIVDKELNKFDSEFVKVDQGTLFELVLAANYLDVKQLLELTCKSVADIIKDKSVEEVRKIFNIVNDFTPEEEAELRRENAWAFEEN